jgi:CRP-like cAMP-binding protein
MYVRVGHVLGEAEFFTRGIYGCSARAHTDCTVFVLSFDDFWELVVEYSLEDAYIAAIAQVIKHPNAIVTRALHGHLHT